MKKVEKFADIIEDVEKFCTISPAVIFRILKEKFYDPKDPLGWKNVGSYLISKKDCNFLVGKFPELYTKPAVRGNIEQKVIVFQKGKLFYFVFVCVPNIVLTTEDIEGFASIGYQVTLKNKTRNTYDFL